MDNVVAFVRPGTRSPGTRTPGTRTPDRATRHPEPLWRHVVGDVLRRERTERGERIVDVAERAGVAPQYLSEIERGRKDPSSEVLSALAGALDLTVQQVATRAARTLAGDGLTCLAA